MPSKSPAQRLRDIIDNIAAIDRFTAGFDEASFYADQKTVYAVVRALEILSEASRRLPAELKQRHPGIDWPAIAAAGNVYRHEYEGIDVMLIWHTIQHDLDALRVAAESEWSQLKQ